VVAVKIAKRGLGIGAAALLVALAGAGDGLAEVTPAPAADAALDAQKAAFMALSEADRKAVQDALGWLGLYNGVVDGAFGKRTRDSIIAYQQKVGALQDGIVSPTELAALKAAAEKAKAAVGFAVIDDPTTGIRIGAPMKILDKHTLRAGDPHYSNADDTVTLDLGAPKGADANLQTIYAFLSADATGRKVVYKAIKADAFFVVTGEEAGKKFYARFNQGAAGAPEAGLLRGFRFAYPLARAAEFDRIALAVANSFDPFGSLQGAQPKTAEKEPTPAPSPTPTPKPTPAATVATALIVAPGEALTALKAADCPNPKIGDKPAQVTRADAASGLALLAGDFGADAKAPALTGSSADAVVLSFAAGATPAKATLEASAATLTPLGEGRNAVLAPLSRSASGAPVFARSGALIGVVGSIEADAKRIGGQVLSEPHPMIDAGAVGGFLSLPVADVTQTPPPLGLADLARGERGLIVVVVCQ